MKKRYLNMNLDPLTGSTWFLNLEIKVFKGIGDGSPED
jgi:hypothetical protein